VLPAGGEAVNEPGPVTSKDAQPARPVFISYATADRKEALSICTAIERRGTQCWISTRDVAPGENYQEAIVHSVRDARAMVLVFSDAANNSDEIKKELSLASRYHVPVMALRIEDVEPSDAFAYELSTRQWIDAFEGWDKSIDALVTRLEQVSGTPATAAPVGSSAKRRARVSGLPLRTLAVVAAIVLVIFAAFGAWLLMRPKPVIAHTMQVRLTGFARLSPDLPVTMPAAIDDEIDAAFNDEGVIGISRASAPPPGTAPAYALGGTMRHDGDKVKVIVRLTDERSGGTLWTDIYSYDTADLSRVPRWTAVKTSAVVRCGLFGASTYPKALSNQTLSDYLQECAATSATKALDLAHKVVAAAPDFSWGWSAVEAAAAWAGFSAEGATKDAFRKESLDAADKAIRLDPSNSEAISGKSLLIGAGDLIARESLLKQGIAARPLACGCEHHLYGAFLVEVGRLDDAITEFRRGVDVLPLNPSTQFALAEALIAAGKPEQSKEPIETLIDISDDPTTKDQLTVMTAPLTAKYSGTEPALLNPKVEVPEALRHALVDAYRAMQSGNPQAKATAAAGLEALPATMHGEMTVLMLGALGANAQALKQIEEAAARDRIDVRGWLFYPSMAGALRDGSFPAVAQRLGLIEYWKTTHTKPDVCTGKDPPPFCRMI